MNICNQCKSQRRLFLLVRGRSTVQFLYACMVRNSSSCMRRVHRVHTQAVAFCCLNGSVDGEMIHNRWIAEVRACSKFPVMRGGSPSTCGSPSTHPSSRLLLSSLVLWTGKLGCTEDELRKYVRVQNSRSRAVVHVVELQYAMNTTLPVAYIVSLHSI